jgi:hypothetical protein
MNTVTVKHIKNEMIAFANLNSTIFPNFHPTFKSMYSKFWLIIKDDATKTFEVCGQAAADNAFTNKVYGMQRSGMNISCVVLPVTNKTSSKDLIKITGYSKEDGLYERLQGEHRKRMRESTAEWDSE